MPDLSQEQAQTDAFVEVYKQYYQLASNTISGRAVLIKVRCFFIICNLRIILRTRPFVRESLRWPRIPLLKWRCRSAR